MGRPVTPAIERFWKHIEKKPNGCWEWVRSVYGYTTFWNGCRKMPAHRFAHETFVGPIDDPLEIDHLCRNPRCVNPEHLEAVTHSINVKRGLVPILGRQQMLTRHAAVTRCRRGHAYEGDNVRLYYSAKDGYVRRCCRECNRIRNRRRYAAKDSKE